MNKYLLVKLANPYKNEFGSIELSDNNLACLYICENNKRHENLLILTPIDKFALVYPVDSISEKELKRENKRIFTLYEHSKAIGFTDYINDFIKYLELCKLYPNKYYLQFGRNTIKCKYNKNKDTILYFINGAYYFINEIYDMIFKCAWEYEDLKLCKYNLFNRIFNLK